LAGIGWATIFSINAETNTQFEIGWRFDEKTIITNTRDQKKH
jgi:hypothetical protein